MSSLSTDEQYHGLPMGECLRREMTLANGLLVAAATPATREAERAAGLCWVRAQIVKTSDLAVAGDLRRRIRRLHRPACLDIRDVRSSNLVAPRPKALALALF